jgi:hypothetical protein
MHMICHMFRIVQIAKSIAKTTPTILAHLDAKARAEKERTTDGDIVLVDSSLYDLTQSKNKKVVSPIMPRPRPKP